MTRAPHGPARRALALLAASAAALAAQDDRPAACVRDLDRVAALVERTWAGWPDAVTPASRARLDAARAAARTAAATAATDDRCDDAIRGWLRALGDAQLAIAHRDTGALADTTPAALRARFAGEATVRIDEAEARRRLERLGARRTPIEGIWESGTGTYRVAILRDDVRDDAPTAWTMHVLRTASHWWSPGQVKGRFTPDSVPGRWRLAFRLRDHTPVDASVRPVRNILPIRGEPWRRIAPVEPGDLDATDAAFLQPVRTGVHEAAEGTLVVQLPSFADRRALDSLWRDEGDRIGRATRLVLDLRGNRAGDDEAWAPFGPLLYTAPIRLPARRVRASEETVRAWRDAGADRATLARLEQARGPWVDVAESTMRAPAVLEYPSRVDLVVDRGCAGACERFVLAARQSRKVRVYGERTAGAAASAAVRDVPVPGSTRVLRVPTARLRGLPASVAQGIAPDVPVPASVGEVLRWVLVQPAGTVPSR